MKTLHVTALLAGAMALGSATPALSHHSHAMYDHAKEVVITGNVTNFAYTNPHGELDVAVNQNGKMVSYWIEMSNLTNMVARGITPATFKKGDKITVKMHPLKDGRAGGSYTIITAANGKNYE
jgi:hypothetical protein